MNANRNTGWQDAIRNWLKLALDPVVVRRAAKYAVVVGAVLIAINHGDAILRDDIDVIRWFRIGLTVLVPYCISTSSSVEAIQNLKRRTPPIMDQGEA